MESKRTQASSPMPSRSYLHSSSLVSLQFCFNNQSNSIHTNSGNCLLNSIEILHILTMANIPVLSEWSHFVHGVFENVESVTDQPSHTNSGWIYQRRER
jgi:hypothetical protein